MNTKPQQIGIGELKLAKDRKQNMTNSNNNTNPWTLKNWRKCGKSQNKQRTEGKNKKRNKNGDK